jgi:hypothetical protein
MKITPDIIFNWPEMPALPPPGQPVLIRVATTQPRQIARQELRNVLRRILETWIGGSPALPLSETSRGPVWSGQLGGHPLDISLSYADGEGWIGLLRAGQIGVDVMPAQSFPEIEAVTRHYLGPADVENILRSTDPSLAFAVAWTGLEARLKCLKQPLTEWSEAPALAMTNCRWQSLVLPECRVVTVAIRLG